MTGRRYLTLAWLSLAGFVVLAIWGLAQGPAKIVITSEPMHTSPWPFTWIMLSREIPAMVAYAVPGTAAWIFGRLARRAGERRGAVPAWIGLTVSVGFILLSIVAVLPLG